MYLSLLCYMFNIVLSESSDMYEKRIYEFMNNIDMVLLRTSYMYGTFSNTILDYNLVRFGVCMIKLKLRHERMLILRFILPPP